MWLLPSIKQKTPLDFRRSFCFFNSFEGAQSKLEEYLYYNGEDIAIHKKGNTFRLYSYATGDVIKPMTAGELDGHLEKVRESSPAQDYSSIKELSAQSRKFLREYRKMFNELAKRNQGNNALSRALETTPGIEKTVTSMNDENMQVTDKRFALKESAYKIELSNDFVNKILEHYKITKPSDYIHVQKQVITTLADNNFFTDNENRRLTEINEATGMVVELNKSGIYETFNLNNYGRLGINKKIAKLAVLQQVPDAIKKGRVIADDVENVHYDGGNKKFAYIEYDTELDGREISVKLVIKKSSQKNKFWVHSVYTSENASGSSASTKNSAEAGHITADISNSIPQNQKKSTLSGEKISNGRHALPKTDKNSAKRGTSTVADIDKIEVSRGKLEQMRANYKGDKVFYKKDVVAALKGIDALAKLPADMREDIANRLWRGDKQKRRAIALLFICSLSSSCRA